MTQFMPLQPDNIYHIYNHAVGDENIFRSVENYDFFLDKIEQYLLPVMDIFTYSLLPNHFHLMVRIKQEDTIASVFDQVKGVAYNSNTNDLSGFVMERISNCLNSYAKAFNKYYDRMGSLFMPTKRTIAAVDGSLTNFVLYVHKNAVHHGITQKIGEWKFDSYNKIIGNDPTWLLREELFEWFGSRKEFIRIHEHLIIERKF